MTGLPASFATTRQTLVLDAACHGSANTSDSAAGRALYGLFDRASLLAHARFRVVLHKEVSHTAARAEEIDAELRHLMAALAS